MVNNFDIIKKIINFDNPGDFYFLEIIMRKKENPNITKNHRVVKNYYIRNSNDFTNLEDEVIQLCTQYNARAYMRLNRRNDKIISLYLLKLVTGYVISNDYFSLKRISIKLLNKNIDNLNNEEITNSGINILNFITDCIKKHEFSTLQSIYHLICGKYHTEINKTWIVDIDFKDMDILITIKNIIHSLQLKTNKVPLIYEIPTKNGYHLIASPFNVADFNKIIKGKFEVSIHKDNPTILYCP